MINRLQRTRRRRFICVLAVCACMALSGCWDYIETSRLAIIGTMGIDLGPDGKPLVSMEVLNAEGIARGAGQSGAPSKVVSWVMLQESDTILGAIRAANRRSPRQLFAGQMSTLIFGQAFARKGIRPYLDVFERIGQFRRSSVLTTCDTGAGLLQRPFIEELPSRTLAGLVNNAERTGETVAVTFNEFLRKESLPGIEPITVHTAGRTTQDLYVKRQGEPANKEDPAVKRPQPIEAETVLPGELPPDSPALDPLRESGTAEVLPGGMTFTVGIAAYRDDKFVGFLDGREARGYLWAVGRMKSVVMEVPDPTAPERYLSVELLRLQASIRPILRGTDIRFAIEVKPEVAVTEAPDESVLGSIQVIQRLTQAVNKLIGDEIHASLYRVQRELKTDIYGFGNLIYQKNPRLWSQLEGTWNEETLPGLVVDVTVDSEITMTGLLLPRLRR